MYRYYLADEQPLETARKLLQKVTTVETTKHQTSLSDAENDHKPVLRPKNLAIAVPGMFVLCCAFLCPCFRARRKEAEHAVLSKEPVSSEFKKTLEQFIHIKEGLLLMHVIFVCFSEELCFHWLEGIGRFFCGHKFKFSFPTLYTTTLRMNAHSSYSNLDKLCSLSLFTLPSFILLSTSNFLHIFSSQTNDVLLFNYVCLLFIFVSNL